MGMPLIVGSSSCMILKLMSCTRHWVDSVAMRFAGDDCLVHDVHGNREHSLFHCTRTGERDKFESYLSQFTTWAAQCNGANVSAGKYMYYAIAPSGRGTMQITPKKLWTFSVKLDFQ